MAFYTRQYMRLRLAARSLTQGLEEVFYNAQHEFTLQYPLLLAPLTLDDDPTTVDKKLRLVGIFLDILIARRLWNFRVIAYSTMQYAMFLVMRDIRGKTLPELADILRQKLDENHETFTSNDRLRLHQQNRNAIHQFLSRITDHIEQQSALPSRYREYVSGTGNDRYEVEHIWANMPDRHTGEFPQEADFYEYRNRIGGLLLLPKSFNASYGALSYEKKLPEYLKQNILAQSLNSDCYSHNPGFLRYLQKTALPFTPHMQFTKADLDARQVLYQKLAEEIWNPDRLTKVLEE